MTLQNNPLLKAEEKGWYDLFSRGARDWLRHNDKVRDSVMDHLPEIIAGPDIISRPDNRTIQVPVKFLEHYRFRLHDTEQKEGVGQGKQGQVKPGDVLRSVHGQDAGNSGGTGEGGYNFVLELKVDDIVDWLWEELQLPNLEPKPGGTLEDKEFVREGWDKRGVRSRLDRRRTMKEAIKRRSIQKDSPAIINDDLRFRQLTTRKQPATNAVIFFVLDASSSMGQEDRRLAKMFYFWILQGLRRQYTSVEIVFIAHTSMAWEFTEEEFFNVTAEGGTECSTAMNLVLDVYKSRYNPDRYNGYLFYASDGDNFFGDRQLCIEALSELGLLLNFMGYAEISQYRRMALQSELGVIFELMVGKNLAVGSYSIKTHEDIWPVIKKFFMQQTEQEAA